jgi:DNA polymerase I
MTEIIRDQESVQALLQRLEASGAVPLGFDTEQSGRVVQWKDRKWLDWYSATLTGFSIAVEDFVAYVPVDHAEGGNCPYLDAYTLLHYVTRAIPRRRVWAHNWKADLQILRNVGLGEFAEEAYGSLTCSMVAAWLAGWGADHKSLKLKKLAESLGLGAGDTFAELAKGRQARDVPVAEMAPYAGRDAWLTRQIGEQAYAALTAAGLTEHFHTIDMPLVEICRDIEAWGTRVDADRVREQMERLSAEAASLADEFEFLTVASVAMPVKVREPTGDLYKNGNPKMRTVERDQQFVLGAKIGNDHQVSRWLYEELKWWPIAGLKRNGAGHYPVDKETIERFAGFPDLGGRAARIRLDWAWRDKLVKTYLKPLLELPPQYADGLLHTSLNLTGTQTQRFSSSNPNLQNVPSRTEEGRAIRKALRSRDGWRFIIFDYSQIELRIMAHLSRDPEMMACYWLDIDIHAGTLEQMRKTWAEATRTDAKVTNFSTIYRISPPSLATKMRTTLTAAEASIEAFYARFSGVSAYHEAAIAYASTHGYARTIDGFRRPLDVTQRYNPRTKRRDIAWHVANEAINTPIQGSAAGLAKIAMVRMWRRWRRGGEYGTRVHLAGQEHDAIIAEAREDFVSEAMEHMREDMESALTLRVPLRAEGGSGDSWGTAKAA